jgi:hypothetical protein
MIIDENQITRELVNRHKFEFTKPRVSGGRRGGGFVLGQMETESDATC